MNESGPASPDGAPSTRIGPGLRRPYSDDLDTSVTTSLLAEYSRMLPRYSQARVADSVTVVPGAMDTRLARAYRAGNGGPLDT